MRFVLLCALLLPATAHADDLFVEVARTGSTVAATAAGTKWEDPGTHQVLAGALVQTDLLETLNWFAVGPKSSDGALDLSAVKSVGRAVRGDRAYAFLAKDERVHVAFARVRVPVDVDADEGEGWSPNRLRARREVLRALSSFRLAPKDKDRYGNVFAWIGRAPGGAVYVRYVPDDDVMLLLYVSANRS